MIRNELTGRWGIERTVKRLLILAGLIHIAMLLAAAPVSAGINTWKSNGPYGGTIGTLAIAPTHPDTIYAGSWAGGVYTSTNGGESWSQNPVGLVMTVAVDPQTPTILYAGTQGSGVSKSTDGGNSWRQVNTGIPAYADIWGLAINPLTPTTLFAATSPGVYRSTNGGDSWSPVNTGIVDTYVFSLVIDPTAPATVYAGTYTGKIYKSTNGGDNWTQINVGADTYGNIRVLALDPLATTTIYAGTDGNGILKGINSGSSWSQMNTGLTSISIKSVAIAPSTPATLYAGTTGGLFKSTTGGSSWSPVAGCSASVIALAIDSDTPSTLYAGTSGGGVYKSTNSGNNWRQVNTGMSVPIRYLSVAETTPATIYASTGGGGVYKSTDGGNSWIQASSGLPVFYMGTLVVDPLTPATLYTNVDYNGIYKSTNGGDSWNPINNGLSNISNCSGRGLAVDPTNPAILYAGGCGSAFSAIYKSIDSGGNWSVLNGLNISNSRVLTIDPVNPAKLFLGTYYGGVYRSTDSGAHWSTANTNLTSYDRLSTIVIDPVTPSTLYAATETGGVFKSTTGGDSWSQAGNVLTTTNVRSLAIDPANPATVYAGTAGKGLYKSTNGGVDWQQPTPGQTDTIYALAVPAASPNTVYAGTVGGAMVLTSAPTAPAAMVTPTNGSTLTGSNQTFTWSYTGADLYSLWVGTSVGAQDLGVFPSAGTTGTTATVTGLPTNGSTIYVRLWSQVGENWVSSDYSYTAAASAATTLTPANGSTLTGSSQTFTWNSSGASLYSLWVGTSAGAQDLGVFPSAAGTTGTSATATGLPTNGSTIYVRLWSQLGTNWVADDYTYIAAGGPATMLTPVNGSTLTGASQTFTWNSSGASLYSLWVGTSAGAQDLGVFPSAAGTTGTTATATGLPTNGSTIYVRLWSQLGENWVSHDYSYTAAASAATMLTPANGSTLTGFSQTFAWDSSGASLYSVWVGTTAGAQDLGVFPSAAGTTGTSAIATGLPTNGSTIYVRLWSQLGTNWVFNDYSYAAGGGPATMLTPANASTLTGSSQTFTWNSSGASLYSIWVGTSSGAQDLGVFPSAAGTTGTSATATGLPTNGSTIYVRLWSEFGGNWLHNDYTYTTVQSVATVITTFPAGLAITVDGTTYTSPHTFSWVPGSSHTITTIAAQAGIAGTRYAFANWADAGALIHQITVPAAPTTYTANFTTQYQLSTAVTPAGSGYVLPATGGWYDANSVVNLSVVANTGKKISGWSGPVASPASETTTVTMSAPQNVTATLVDIPSLSALVTGKSGLIDNRLWTVSLSNAFTSTAVKVIITGLDISAHGGTGCTPSIVSGFPIAVNDVAPGAPQTGGVSIDFTGCDVTQKFDVQIDYSYRDGSGSNYTGRNSYYNMLR